ncbi:helix-turn-helix domain-containing protein [Mucilaginibacter robiniae]|uniref:Helix-turn-helix domain-containing protein n=1 Tax=Mucilaginibacter robiniae TaxID=2728022 RepID=A0A7L5E343_9SPHI|nr:helix-turn-helix domain-containing protein [Mucilaginibacter robiniae]QJD95213.1 helix-turn-helix domain-containing protein [Mucilaginibacter robiniae]
MAIETKFICLEDTAFEELIKRVVAQVKAQTDNKEDKWIDASEAMKKLRISSRTTLQNLRDDGSIEFTKLSEKHILYNTHSIDRYLEKHAKKTF